MWTTRTMFLMKPCNPWMTRHRKSSWMMNSHRPRRWAQLTTSEAYLPSHTSLPIVLEKQSKELSWGSNQPRTFSLENNLEKKISLIGLHALTSLVPSLYRALLKLKLPSSNIWSSREVNRLLSRWWRRAGPSSNKCMICLMVPEYSWPLMRLTLNSSLFL